MRTGWIPLLQRQLDFLFYPRCELIPHNEAGAGIPVQQCIVIFGRSQRFRLFVPGHRFAQQFVGVVAGARMTLTQLRFRPALADDAGIISSLVRIMKMRSEPPGPG